MDNNKEPTKPGILIADDEEVIRDLLKRCLSKEGYETSTAVDGLDALNKIKSHDYSMLILDLKMPKMGGMELLSTVRQFNRDLIIIVITGYATIETAKEAIKSGCLDYITKPFNIEDISVIIKRSFEKQKLIEEKKKLEQQLQTAERLASLAQMGAGVAHEVNTVLTAVKLFIEMLKSKLPRTQRVIHNTALILKEIERAEKLISRFLNFTKPDRNEFIKIDINKVIKQSVQFLQDKLRANGIDAVVDFKDGVVVLLCDALQIEEIFLNLISNSIDAMPKGGRLYITSRIQQDKAVINVSDTGAGIPQENISKVFNPFFTTKPTGTGLGLSIVHRIIEEHKGRIEISSQEGKGTDVRIELPVSP